MISDVDKSIEFYRETLGLDLEERGARSVELDTGEHTLPTGTDVTDGVRRASVANLSVVHRNDVPAVGRRRDIDCARQMNRTANGSCLE